MTVMMKLETLPMVYIWQLLGEQLPCYPEQHMHAVLCGDMLAHDGVWPMCT